MSKCKFIKRELTEQLKNEILDLQSIAKTYPKQLIGAKIYVFWEGDDFWYKGQVVKYLEKTKRFKLIYDDNEVIKQDLSKDLFFIHESHKKQKLSVQAQKSLSQGLNTLQSNHKVGKKTMQLIGKRKSANQKQQQQQYYRNIISEAQYKTLSNRQVQKIKEQEEKKQLKDDIKQLRQELEQEEIEKKRVQESKNINKRSGKQLGKQVKRDIKVQQASQPIMEQIEQSEEVQDTPKIIEKVYDAEQEAKQSQISKIIDEIKQIDGIEKHKVDELEIYCMDYEIEINQRSSPTMFHKQQPEKAKIKAFQSPKTILELIEQSDRKKMVQQEIENLQQNTYLNQPQEIEVNMPVARTLSATKLKYQQLKNHQLIKKTEKEQPIQKIYINESTYPDSESGIQDPNLSDGGLVLISDFEDFSLKEVHKVQPMRDSLDMINSISQNQHQTFELENMILQDIIPDFDMNLYVKKSMEHFYCTFFRRGFEYCKCNNCRDLVYPILIKKDRDPKDFEQLHQSYNQMMQRRQSQNNLASQTSQNNLEAKSSTVQQRKVEDTKEIYQNQLGFDVQNSPYFSASSKQSKIENLKVFLY